MIDFRQLQVLVRDGGSFVEVFDIARQREGLNIIINPRKGEVYGK